MKAVIPCAKKKEMMWPFSESRPTGLMPVMGKPVVKHLINGLQDIGVDDIYLVTNYLEEQFEEEFDEYTNVNIIHQEELEGTGAAVAECDFIEEDFFIVNGDVIVSGNDLKRLKKKHESAESPVTMLATDGQVPEKFGVLSIQNDKVVSLIEKPEEAENPLVNTGIYITTPGVFDEIEKLEGDKIRLTDALASFIESEEARYELITDYWVDIDSPENLIKADRIKREHEVQETSIHEDADVHESVEITGKAKIEKGAIIKPGAVIEGTVFIGKDSRIGPNTVIRDSTLSYDAQVRNADVENSLFFENCIVDPYTFIEGSILGEGCDIKADTVIRESLIGPESFVEMNNSIYGTKFVPNARTDLSEISK